MKKTLCLIACLVLAGCTDADWNRMVNYGGGDEVETVVPPARPATAAQPVMASPAAPSNDDFCKGVATQDATSNAYDPATQQRVLRQSYAQCLTIYTR